MTFGVAAIQFLDPYHESSHQRAALFAATVSPTHRFPGTHHVHAE